MTDSPRAELDMVFGYDRGETDYTAVVVYRRNEDGTLETINELVAPGASCSRVQLLSLCIAQILGRLPKVVRVRVGQGEPHVINNRTVEDIIEGRLTLDNLLIT